MGQEEKLYMQANSAYMMINNLFSASLLTGVVYGKKKRDYINLIFLARRAHERVYRRYRFWKQF